MATPAPVAPEAVRSRMQAEAPGAAERAATAVRTGTHRTLTALLCAGVIAPVVATAIGAAPVLAATLAAVGGISSGPLANLVTRSIDRLRRDEGDPTGADIETALATAFDAIAEQDTEEAAEIRHGMAALLAQTGAIPSALEGIVRDENMRLLAGFQAELERFGILTELADAFPGLRDSVVENLRLSRGIAEGQDRAERGRVADAAERRRFQARSVEADRRMTAMLHTLVSRIGTGGERTGRDRGFGDGSPYRGLYPFTEDDAAVFFGRDHQVFKLLDHASECLDSSGMLAVTASSGAGKTSLLRAGVFPLIRDGWWIERPGSESWPLLYLTPGVDPLGALAAELAHRIGGVLAIEVRRALSEAPERAHLLVRQALPQSGAGEAARTVLVVDQFEELFTLTEDEKERQAFVTALASIAQGGIGDAGPDAGACGAGLLVIGVRSDYLDACARHAELRPAVEDHLHFLAPMCPDQMRQAITGPAFATGLRLEEGLAEVVLEDLRDSSSGAEFSPAALPLLSQAMRKVWEGRKDGRLTKAAYGRFGGVSKALQASADEVYEALSDERRDTAERLFRRLAKVTRSGGLVRTPLSWEAVRELGAGTAEVIEVFAAARLIAVGEATVEIAHDALLRHWTKLGEWLEGDRESLAIRTALVEDAEEWDVNGEDRAFLYSGARLETAETERRHRWEDRPDRFEPLDETALRFLAASRRRERRGRRVRRSVTSALASLLVLALVAVGIAVTANRELGDQRDRALSVQLAAESAQLRGTDGQLAQLLAAAAWNLGETDEAFTAMTNAADDPTIGRLTGDRLNNVSALEYSPDGSMLLTTTLNGAYTLWTTDTWEAEHLGAPYGGGSTDAVFSSDGALMVTSNHRAETRVWDVDSRTVELRLGREGYASLAISQDDSTLAATEESWTGLWDLATGEELARLESDSSPTRVEFSSDGETLFTGDAEGAVHQWDLATGEIISSQVLGAYVSMIWASPTSPELVIACTDIGCHYLNEEGGWDHRISTAAGTAEMSPDGALLSTTDFQEDLTVWNARTAEPLADFPNGDASSFAFHPNGSILAGGTTTGVQLWDLDRALPASTLLPRSDQDDHRIESLSYAAETDRLIGTGSSGSSAWDLSGPPHSDDELLGRYPEHPGDFSSMSPDGELVATPLWSHLDRGFQLWDPDTGEIIATLGERGGLVIDLEFSPDGTLLASAEENTADQSDSMTGGVRFWDVETGEETLRLHPLEGDIEAIEFSPDGRAIATVNVFGLVQLWDVVSGELKRSFLGNNDHVRDLDFSHDGGTLIAHTDHGFSSWAVESGAHTVLAQGSTADLFYYDAFGFSPDDRYVGLQSSEGLVLWDVVHDMAAAEIPDSENAFDALFIPGEWRVIVMANGTVRVVDVGFLADPYAAVCEEAGRELTEEEWETYLPDIAPEDLEVC